MLCAVLARVGVRSAPSSEPGIAERSSARSHAHAFVAGSFLFGWLAGLAIVLKLWHLAHAPRWMIVSGVGYVTLMLPPTITGFALAWCTGRLAGRGWGPASLGLAAAGVAGLVAGLLAL
jgi:hypothetical protein